MRRLFRPGFRVALISVAMAVLQAGCLRPDHRPLFQPDFEQAVSGEDAAPIPLPDGVRPRPKEPDIVSVPESGSIHLTVEQAVMLALQNNLDLRVRQLNPVIAGTFEEIERGAFDPELFGEAYATRDRTEEGEGPADARIRVSGSETGALAGIRQRLPSGTTVAATADYGRTNSDTDTEEQTARLGLSVTQSLLRGFGPTVNLVSVRQAGLETLASRYVLRGFTQALMADTETAYWNLALAAKEIAIFERSLAVARQQLDEVEQRIAVGVLPEIEAPAARAEVSRREQALIDARSNLEERRLRLLRLIYPAPDNGLDRRLFTVTEPSLVAEPITDLADRLQLAETLRPDLNEARLRLEQNRLETIVTRNGLLPLLEVFVDLGGRAMPMPSGTPSANWTATPTTSRRGSA